MAVLPHHLLAHVQYLHIDAFGVTNIRRLARSLSLRRCYACLLLFVFPLVIEKSITLGKELEHGQLFDGLLCGLRAEPVVYPKEGGRDAPASG
jgi:hypothetical protein